jgi:hypothetical protein
MLLGRMVSELPQFTMLVTYSRVQFWCVGVVHEHFNFAIFLSINCLHFLSPVQESESMWSSVR